jgi:hypothetical protein
MKSFASKDEIIDNANSVPRVIRVPSALVGYFADWIEDVAKMKVNKLKKEKEKESSTTLNVGSSIKPN